MLDKNTVLVSGACLYKEKKGKRKWFLIKQSEEEGWEIPKVLVRKGESSVRASLRMLGEKGGMSTKVLEEAGRAGGVTTVNGKVLPQRHIYYLIVAKSISGEAVGFAETAWLDYAKAVRRLSSKRERQMIKAAREELKKWKKIQKKKREAEKK